MADYEADAIAQAQADNLTSTQVAGMGYADIADLAGVTLGPNGGSPSDFYYVQVRNAVVTALRAAEEAAADKAAEDKTQAALILLSSPKKVYRDDSGDIVIR